MCAFMCVSWCARRQSVRESERERVCVRERERERERETHTERESMAFVCVLWES